MSAPGSKVSGWLFDLTPNRHGRNRIQSGLQGDTSDSHEPEMVKGFKPYIGRAYLRRDRPAMLRAGHLHHVKGGLRAFRRIHPATSWVDGAITQ